MDINLIIHKKKNSKHKRSKSPKSFLTHDLYNRKKIQLFPKRKKITYEKFKIPQIHEFKNLLTINYNVSQLRSICRNYKQKVSGNKSQLITLLYNYLFYSFYVITIQKIYRGWLQRRINKLRGPAIFNRVCTNATDFYTLDKLTDIPKEQFISWKDNDNFIYGADICSLYNFIDIEKQTQNPYNRNNLPKHILGDVKEILRLSKLFNKKINIKLDNSFDKLTQKKQFELRTLNIFQKIDEYGFITDSNWFLTLNRLNLQRFLKELVDIWEYRAQISNIIKRKINPEHGNPFFGYNISILQHKCFEVLQKKVLDLIEIFITKGESADYISLGIYYVLGALTIVNNHAAAALPWLYESFIPNSPI